MTSLLPKSSEELIYRARCVGGDYEPGAREREIGLREDAQHDPNKFTSARLSNEARFSYGSALTTFEPIASELDRLDDESAIPEEDDPDGKRLSFDGEDLGDLEDDPRFADYLR